MLDKAIYVKIGDHFVDKNGIVFIVRNQQQKEITNACGMAIRLASEEEIEEYYGLRSVT